MSALGYCKPGLEATKSPTPQDIAWAAGIWEGEGSCQISRGTCRATVCQKDTWLLYKFQELFGGSVRTRDALKVSKIGNREYPRTISEWYTSGARARGFLMTIYKFLSPRRKDQVRVAFEIQPKGTVETNVATHG